MAWKASLVSFSPLPGCVPSQPLVNTRSILRGGQREALGLCKLFGDLGDGGRRENRESLGLDHPIFWYHSSREPQGCTKPDIVCESHPQAKDRWIWWNKDGKLLLSVSTVPIPVPKTWSVHPPVTPILIFLMNLDLKAPCFMSQSYRCITDGLGENFLVAALQMSLPHCCLWPWVFQIQMSKENTQRLRRWHLAVDGLQIAMP